MMNKKEYITELAGFLVKNQKTMNIRTLVEHLNWNEYRTDNGTKYTNGRGIYKLIIAVYKWNISVNNPSGADNVAIAYKKPDGTYAYDK